MDYYFIQLEGVYYQGVYWIGTDREEGEKELEKLVEGDQDDYHEWILYKFNASSLPKTTTFCSPTSWCLNSEELVCKRKIMDEETH